MYGVNIDNLFILSVFNALIADVIGVVTFVFGLASPASGDYTYSGSGFITSIEYSGATEDAPTYSVSIEGSGTLTQNTI